MTRIVLEIQTTTLVVGFLSEHVAARRKISSSRFFRSVHKPSVTGVADEFRAAREPGLAKDVAHVPRDRRRANHKLVRYLSVPKTISDQTKDFHLACGQGVRVTVDIERRGGG